MNTKTKYKYFGPVFLYNNIYAREVTFYISAFSKQQAIAMLNDTKEGQVRKKYKRTDLRVRVQYLMEDNNERD